MNKLVILMFILVVIGLILDEGDAGFVLLNVRNATKNCKENESFVAGKCRLNFKSQPQKPNFIT